MRALRRFTFNLLTLTSLLLLGGVVATWADSYRGTRMIETTRGDDIVKWASDGGVAVLYWNRGRDGHFRWQMPTQRWQVLGLTYVDGRLVRRKPWSMLIVPYWMPAMLAGVLPVAWIVQHYHRKLRDERAADGLCVNCGRALDLDSNCATCTSAEKTFDARA